MLFKSNKLIFNHPKWLKQYISKDVTLTNCNSTHLIYIANELAYTNIINKTGGPFGAIVVDKTMQRIVGVGVNTSISNGSIFHAEVTAIWDALQKLKIASFHEHNHKFILATSSSPCCMCLGAFLWSGIDYLYTGALSQDVENIGFDEGPLPSNLQEDCKKRKIILVEGIYREGCVNTLKLYKELNGKIYN